MHPLWAFHYGMMNSASMVEFDEWLYYKVEVYVIELQLRMIIRIHQPTLL